MTFCPSCRHYRRSPRVLQIPPQVSPFLGGRNFGTWGEGFKQRQLQIYTGCIQEPTTWAWNTLQRHTPSNKDVLPPRRH
eukprot:2836546-Amphidinium_carterae.1